MVKSGKKNLSFQKENSSFSIFFKQHKKDAAFGVKLLAIQLDGVLNRHKDEDMQKCIHVKDRRQVGAIYSALYLKRPNSFLFFNRQKFNLDCFMFIYKCEGFLWRLTNQQNKFSCLEVKYQLTILAT